MSVIEPAPSSRITPQEFLRQASDATPGWSAQHGGPAGVAALCGGLQEQLIRQSEMIAAIRVAALLELLKDHSGREVAAMFNISPSAVSKATRGAKEEVQAW